MNNLLTTLTNTIVGLVILSLIIFVGILFLITRFLRKVEPGKALIIISPFKGVKVSFSGSIVLPVIHRMEVMDISTKMITVERRGSDGLVCKDNIRADISVNFYVRVNPTKEDVTQVAQSIGVNRASTEETLNVLFQAKFSEALKTVGKQMEFEDLFQERTVFKEKIVEAIGQNLNGYSLEDTAIDYLEQTPLESLDENNILDAEGIRKIVEITLTKKEIVEKRTTETRERILELEKQRLEAEAKQKSQISIIRSKEEAAALKIGEEERMKAESARIVTDEYVSVAEVNKDRQFEVALKNKEREIAVEEERVEKDRMLERTEKDKLVALATIEKDRVVEEEKKNIADIIRQRVVVERTVAEEEEETKDVRAFAGADRDKTVAVTAAAKDAESQFILDIKAAEAKEKAATHLAKEKEITAEVEMITAAKFSESKKTLAVGIIAEESASGLAEIKVKEAEADVIKKLGEANAKADEFKFITEAKGIKEKGKAEAESSEFKYSAEAKGIEDKAAAMKKFDDVGKDHEEFKLRLGLEEKVALEQLQVKKQIAEAQAGVLGTALQNAKIDIVGGDGEFFDKITGSIGDGKAASAYVDHNAPLSTLLDALLAKGEDNLVNKIKMLAKETGISTESVKNLTISAVLAKFAANTGDTGLVAEKVEELQKIAKLAGLENVKINKLME